MISPVEITATLRGCVLFADFNDTALATMAGYFELMRGSSGDRLYSEGDPGYGLYVVAEGRCRMLVKDATGRERRVGEAGPGDTFGELGLLLRGGRLVSVVASEPVGLLELSADAFRHLRKDHPDVGLLLIMAIVKRLGSVLDGSREVLKRMLLRQLAGLDSEW